MNVFLSLFLISLGGIANGLHLPVVARSPVPRHMMHNGKPAVQMWQQGLSFTQNVENAKDVVVSGRCAILMYLTYERAYKNE